MKLHVLSAWALFALAGSFFAVSPTQAQHVSGSKAALTSNSPAVSGGADIYIDTLRNGWQNYSWATVNYANPAPVYKGSASISVSSGPWQALYLHRRAFSTAIYSAVSFWINGGPAGGQKLQVQALLSGQPQTPVALSPLSANTWTNVVIPLSALGADHKPNLDGLWIQDTTGTTQPVYYVDQVRLNGVSLTPPVPPAPSGLTAAGQWEDYCATCQMAMAHVILAWNPVASASSYTVLRDGTPLQSSVTAAGFTDMTVNSGQSYTYTVCAVDSGGTGPQSAPVSVTAPLPPPPPGVPTNLVVQGALQNGSPSDTLAWSPVPGAVSYNIYQHDQFVGSASVAAYAVPVSLFNDSLNYTVTAVNAAGGESLPSAQAGAVGAYSLATVPGWVPSAAPAVPLNLAATPDWNSGLPRILVAWQGSGAAQCYNVYRDGQLAASGLWTMYYIDNAVNPGETHTYSVTSVNAYWPGTVESAQSVPVSAQAFLSAPAPLGIKVSITKIIPNDDSCVVFFDPIPGAADYRISDVHNPGKVKYAGLRLSKTDNLAEPFIPEPYCIEWNGIDPAQGADLVVEAVDKPGPFQKMDGMAGPGSMAMDGSLRQAINGQGDPSNVPNALAASDPFHVDCQPAVLTGTQVFSDNFRSENPFATLPMPAPDPRGPFYGLPGDYMEQGNDKWTLKYFGADLSSTQAFVMGNHFMDTLYDGGGPGSSEGAHNNNASLALMPQATQDISGGKVLHVTFEVDAHFDLRRWCDIFIAPAGDLLLNPAKFDQDDGGNNMATASGQMVRWVIKEAHDLSLYNGGQKTDLVQASDWNDTQTLNRLNWDGAARANGSTQDLDKRHRFDLYLSQTHYRIVETTPDGLYNITRDKDFPAGASLPFTQCQVYFIHEVYHTGNDRPETINYAPYDYYWANYRPYADERHWDNFGIEVLPAFPQ